MLNIERKQVILYDAQQSYPLFNFKNFLMKLYCIFSQIKGTGVDGRNYNFTELARVTDFLFIMAYDEQSQIFGTECTARANSGLFDTTGGIMAYLQLGIDPKKLVLGLPWYGYDYNCTATGTKLQQKCYIARVPFRGVNCSDAAGRQLPYSEIYELGLKYGTNYDQHSATQFLLFNVTSNYAKIKRVFQN